MKAFKIFCCLTITVLLSGTIVFILPIPSHARSFTVSDTVPPPVGFVNDFEDIFTASEEKALDSLLSSFEKKTSIQIALITLDTTMVTGVNFEKKTLEFLNTWGVGQKEKNNGIVIGISRGLRRMRIENGFGIEKILTDIETKQVIDTWFIPYYRRSEYFEGTMAGLKELMAILASRYQ